MFNILATKYKPLTKSNNFNGLFVFTTILQKGAKAHLLEHHCDRLKRHATIAGFPKEKLDGLSQQIASMLQKKPTQGFSKTRIQLLLEDDSEFKITLIQTPTIIQKKHEIICTQIAFTHMKPLDQERLKTNNYLPYFKLVKEDQHMLFVDDQNQITSGLFGNFFLVDPTKNAIITPSINSMVLKGITRDWVMETAQHLGWNIVEKNISRNEITSQNSAFFTSSVQGISPITQIDEIILSKHKMIDRLKKDFNYKISQELGCQVGQ